MWWPVREGSKTTFQAELDDIVFSVVRQRRSGVDLNYTLREARLLYPVNRYYTFGTGTLEREDVLESLLRLAIKGLVRRLGTQRHNYFYFDPFEVDPPEFGWPRYRAIGVLEAIARAAA